MTTNPSIDVAPLSVPTRVGWIGTGVMGLPMCGHVLARNHPVTVFNRSRARTEPLLANGAAWADSPAVVAERSDIVFTMVGFPGDVRSVYFGDSGLLRAARPGTILVDMTTTEPSLAREIYAAGRARGVATIDAPVSGGDIGARHATLSIMIGGDKDAVERVTPLLQVMGRSVVHQGEAGAGQHTKMCSQIVLAAEMIGVCESLLYGHKAGLDLETMLTSLRGGAAACWVLENLAPRILKRNFDPGFFVEHFIKDLGIALDEARRMGLALPGLALVHQLYVAVQAQGHGRLGTHALMLALEQMCGTELDQRRAEL
jgi:3-hydroxyisobutyrate dehydrogenase